MNNDLGFLIIFIILPTVLIVSGFWLALIVRSDMRLRAAPEASTEASVSTEEQDVFEADNGLTASSTDASTEEQLTLAAPDEADVRALDSEAEADEDFWTPAPSESREPADATQDESHRVDAESAPSKILGDTANLPEEWSVELESAVAEPQESRPDGSEPVRRSAARMVPSTEHVQRRTGQPPRRTPAVLRSTLRDEDAVEGPDGV